MTAQSAQPDQAAAAGVGAGQVVVAGPDGVGFVLGLDLSQVQSVNVVDTDLLLITTDGTRIVLRDAALRAAVQPDLPIKLGSQLLNAGDLFKRVGQIKPVEGGSFRLQATELKPQSADAASGDDLNIDSTEAKAIAQEISQATKALEKLAQAAQSARISNADATTPAMPAPAPAPVNNNTSTAEKILNSSSSNKKSSGSSGNEGTDTGKDGGTGTDTGKDGSSGGDNGKDGSTGPSTGKPGTTGPGSGRTDSTAPGESTGGGSPYSDTDFIRQLGPQTSKVSNVVALEDDGSTSSVSFNNILPARMTSDNPLKVGLVSTHMAAEPQWGGGGESRQVETRLSIKLEANTTELVIRITDIGSLPPGFTLDGQSVTPGSGTTGTFTFTIPAGTTDFKPTLTWHVAEDGSTVDATRFRSLATLVQRGATGASTAPEKSFKLAYENITSASQYTERDANDVIVVKMAANGYSYDIRGRENSNDLLNGGNGDDILRGLSGNDQLIGGRGKDLLFGGAGADTLDGGTGIDTADYRDSSSGVTVYLSAANQHLNAGGDAQGDVLRNIENLRGSGFNDVLVGNSEANTLNGGGGNDELEGGGGADILDGGEGIDIASYASETTGLIASLMVPANNTGAALGDSYLSIEGLRGGAGDDQITGNNADNTLEGGAGNDLIYGMGGNDRLVGGNGDDILVGGLGRDTLDGGAGNDTASYAQATSGIVASLRAPEDNSGEAEGDSFIAIENLTGSAFNDRLVGDDGGNSLAGGTGDDVLVGGAGADQLSGGEGSDTASYDNATAGVVVSLETPTLLNTGDAFGDTYDSIENLIGSDFADTLFGNSSSNTLRGGRGNDILAGKGGGDIYDGGDGTDTVSYSGANVGVTAYLASGSQSLNSGAATGDTYTRIENLTGSNFNDLLSGDSARNELQGGSGDDVLDGGAGDLGDKLNGGTGIDTVTYVNAAIGVTLSLATGGTSGDATSDEYLDIENVMGSTFADMIDGNAQDNFISGNAGSDTIRGGGGNDILDGGDGDDTFSNTGSGNHYYFGGDGIDTVSYAGFQTALNINLSSTDRNTNGAGGQEFFNSIENLIGGTRNDFLSGDSQNNVLSGGAGNDTLTGADGNDVLIGGEDDDVLIGGLGSDDLQGGSGVDTADYTNAARTGTGADRTGVIVDLANTSQGGGRGTGEARGDSFSGVEAVKGSAFDDTFFAQSTATAFDGAGGSDTVSYESSRTGTSVVLTVNLSTNVGLNGLAAGDTYTAIENIIGSSFNSNHLIGNSGVNRLTGGTANDVLDGAAGNDTLIGGEGSDVLIGGAGTNDLDGGSHGVALITNYAVAGSLSAERLTFRLAGDAASYALSNSSATVNLTTGVGTTGTSDVDTLRNIEHVIGTNQNDSLTGNGSNNELWGRGGDDVLSGLAGDDVLDAGAGNDVLIGGAGRDALFGGDGIDTASYLNYVAAGGERLTVSLANSSDNTGEAEGDVVNGIENLTGALNNANKLVGDDNDNVLTGGNLNDLLMGGRGADTLNGGAGDDLLIGGAGADVMNGDGGFDTVSYAETVLPSEIGIFIDLVNTTRGTGVSTGDAAGDVISASVEKVIGTTGADFFEVGTRNITLVGNGAGTAGADTVSFRLLSTSITATLMESGTTNRLTGLTQNHVYENIANLIGSSEADTLQGNANANVLDGGIGNDILIATVGQSDTLNGGAGIDTASYRNFSADIVATLTRSASGEITGTVTSGSQSDRLVSIEALEGGSGNDTLTGSDGDDILRGGTGQDVVRGGAGDDTLDGGEGDDRLEGGAGNDVLDGGTGINALFGGDGDDLMLSAGGTDSFNGGIGTNTVSYRNAGVGVTVYLANTTGFTAGTNTGWATNDTYTGIQVLEGSRFNDTLYGLDTSETLKGGEGSDTLMSSLDSDILDGGAGIDTVDYSGSNAAVMLNLSLSTQANTGGHALGDVISNVEIIKGSTFSDVITTSNSGTEVYGGLGQDEIRGGSGADKLYGGDGNDTLFGGAGNDILAGGIGDDSITGGDGNDILYAGEGTDLLRGDANDDTFYLDREFNPTSNTTSRISNTLDGDKAYGDAGSDKFFINASDYLNISPTPRLGTSKNPAGFLIDGGAGNDTLTLNFAAAEAGTKFNISQLAGLQFNSIETLDLRTDGVATNVELSLTGIGDLIDSTDPAAKTLTLLLGSGDSYSIEQNAFTSFSGNKILFFDTLANQNLGTEAAARFIVSYSTV